MIYGDLWSSHCNVHLPTMDMMGSLAINGDFTQCC